MAKAAPLRCPSHTKRVTREERRRNEGTLVIWARILVLAGRPPAKGSLPLGPG